VTDNGAARQERRPRRFLCAEGFAMTPRRVGLLTATVLAGTVGGVLCLYPPRMDPWHRRSLFESITWIHDAAVGATEPELREVYGDPTSDRLGSEHPVPTQMRTMLRRFTKPTRRLTFEANGATLVVFLEDCGQEWICVSSIWYADLRQEANWLWQRIQFRARFRRFLIERLGE
jgi:hypothetical protein